MKRLIIIVEGATEQEFVNQYLLPYLNKFGIYDVTPIEITTNRKLKQRGGFVNYDHLKNDIKKSLHENCYVTTFVDFFRIPNNCPGYSNRSADVNRMQEAIDTDINNPKFFSYIQLHEFEALLFSDIKGFEYVIDDIKLIGKLKKVMNDYPNPEDINNSPETAPSKRILNIYPSYDKVAEGNMVIDEIGMSKLFEKNPRFKAWVDRLIAVLS